MFHLPTEFLRDDAGRLDVARIAAAVGLPVRRLAVALGVRYGTIRDTPEAPAVQAALAPFVNLLAMLYDSLEGDQRRAHTWLGSPQAALGGRAPREVLIEPAGVRAVEQLVSGAWLGDPD